MFKLFIRRPILSAVISVIFVCLGVLAIVSLPITQYPDIVPPSVTVTARYTGASADVMTKTVATPLERAINGVPGMTYMTTVCTNDGMSLTTIYFKVGTDPDVAAVNVQNRVTTVLDELPEEVWDLLKSWVAVTTLCVYGLIRVVWLHITWCRRM